MTEHRGSGSPAAPAQSPLWLLQRLEPQTSAYNIAFHLDLFGPLDTPAMQAAWAQVLLRHPVLRCRFIGGDEGPLLLPQPAETLPLDLQSATPATIAETIRAAAATPFDLDEGLPSRATLYEVEPQRHSLAFVFHHSVFDGWSLNLLLVEMARTYSHVLNAGPALTPLASNYLDYAERMHAEYLAGTWTPQLEYWKGHLQGSSPELDLPQIRRQHASPRIGHTTRAVHAGVADPLQALSTRAEATPFMVLLAAYAVLLSRYTDADELVIGTPLATRIRPSVRKLIGLFLNTVALRIPIRSGSTFLEIIHHVKEAALGAFRHYEVPFEKVVEALHPQRRTGHNPLFSAMFITQNAPINYHFSKLRTAYFDDAPTAAKFDLTLSTQVMEEDLSVNLEYADDRLEATTAKGMLDAYRSLLSHALEAPNTPYRDLSLMDRAGSSAQATRWSGPTSASEPPTILDSIHAQVELDSERIAVSCGDRTRSYLQLWSGSELIAKSLAAQGIGAGDRVGVRVPRNEYLPEILLGVLRAGATYIPLDPDAPAARRHAALEDAAAKLIIVDEPDSAETPRGARVMCLSHPPQSAEIPRTTELSAPAYIIYTSGSSGRPKGVQISHRALATFARASVQRLQITAQDRFLATTTVGFDIAVLELLVPLTVGARVLVVPKEIAIDGERLAQTLTSSQATVFQTTPSALRLLTSAGWSGRAGLRVLAGGEALPRDLALDLIDKVGELWNMYGPTEATVWVSARKLARKDLEECPEIVPIGGAFSDTRLYILSSGVRPVPPGARGELCIAGPQVADGYVGQPELNSSHFVPDPFTPGSLLYRTGDVVRAHYDNTIEFLGRRDQQLKIRGFRVEPAEIEAVLRKVSGLHDAVVTTTEHDGLQELVAYVVTQKFQDSQNELRERLREELPPYMVPAFIHIVGEIPRNSNGKLDRSRLPAPRALRPRTLHAPPTDPVEAQLLELWRGLLGRRDLGANDNFFDVGGHSMLAAKLAQRVEAAFGRGLPVSTFFHAQTVNQQAKAIREGGFTPKWQALEPIKTSGSQRPVFYIGASDQARLIADKLPAEQPLYALKVLGLPEEHALTVDAITDTYVREMRQFQSVGPYALSAYCQDAKLALAVARKLQAQGQEISGMVYVDTVWLPREILRPKRQLAENLLDMGPRYAVQWVNERAKQRVKAFSGRAYDTFMAQKARYTPQDVPLTTRQRNRLREFRKNLDNYPETAFEGDLDILLCQEFHRPGAERALAEMCTGHLRVFEIPGLHRRIFGAPGIYWLASRLAHCIEAKTNEGDVASSGDLRPQAAEDPA